MKLADGRWRIGSSSLRAGSRGRVGECASGNHYARIGGDQTHSARIYLQDVASKKSLFCFVRTHIAQ
eukprot:6193380-Pleurochrysis_carterae.AAC.2